MRLREAGVAEGTIADVLWHSTKTMTQHYSVAQVVELHAALEKIKDESSRWNKTLAMLKREQEGERRDPDLEEFADQGARAVRRGSGRRGATRREADGASSMR